MDSITKEKKDFISSSTFVQIGCTNCADALHSLCGWLAQFVRMRCTKSADDMHKICTSVEKAVDNFVKNPVDNYLLIH